MKPQIATSPEQSHRLIICGVDLNSADMCWTQLTHRIDGSPIKKSHQKANLWIGYPCKRVLEDDEQRIDTPAWSLDALLALLPYGDGQEIKFIYDPFDEDRNLITLSNPIKLSGDIKLYRNDSNYWIVDYDWNGFQGTLPQDKDPIEAVVRAIELLCANNVSLNTPKL